MALWYSINWTQISLATMETIYTDFNAWLYAGVAAAAAVALILVGYYVIIPLIRRVIIASIASKYKIDWLELVVTRSLLRSLWALIVVGALLLVGVALDELAILSSVWGERILGSILAIIVTLLIGQLLTIGNNVYARTELGRERPLKGFVQLAKLVLYGFGAIVVFAVLTGQPVVYYISGLGAITAVLILVFKDTLLSVVATLQIRSDKSIRIGDWIEAPAYGIDGAVVDMSLYSITVQNWNKTLSNLPTADAVTTPIKNWRGMEEARGRRIKRSIMVDMSSVKFLTDKEIERFQRFLPLRDYIKGKQDELKRYNAGIKVASGEVGDARRLTNLGTFRAYMKHYLLSNPKIESERLTLLVRQLAPTVRGLPLEIYAFTNDIDWINYEEIQSDIFDHLIAMMKDFGLRPFQQGILEATGVADMESGAFEEPGK